MTEELAETLADKCTRGGAKKVGNFRPLDKNDAKQIYLGAAK